MLNEFYRIAFRKKIYATISELQKDLDVTSSLRKAPRLKSTHASPP